MTKVAILGSGMVGDALAAGFLKRGDAVQRGSRDPAKLAEWAEQAGDQASAASSAEAAAWGELVVLAVKGAVAEAVIEQAGPAHLAGKTVIDACNDGAKAEVTAILEAFGWEAADMGTAKAARAIEPLAMLWCIPGFRSNSWSHAFKLLKG